jgi:hypothetical protein
LSAVVVIASNRLEPQEELMPLIKPRTNRVKRVRHICHLQEPNRNVLTLYARFIGDTADYVVNQLIETTIAKDREFLAWRAEQPASDAPALTDADLPADQPLRAAATR